MKRFLIIILIIVGVFLLKYLYSNRNYLEIGENRIFTLDMDESVTIKLRSNGSTGYSNCWINRMKCQHTELIDTEYEGSINENLGFDGAGGCVYWTFKANTIGVDTIKIASCPVGREQKSCEEFSDTSFLSYLQLILVVE